MTAMLAHCNKHRAIKDHLSRFAEVQRSASVGRISGEATPSDKNNEFTRNSPTYRVSDTNYCFVP